jgi:hypothetical protein
MDRADRNAGLSRDRADAHARGQQWRNRGPSGILGLACLDAANRVVSAFMAYFTASDKRVAGPPTRDDERARAARPARP